MMATRMVRPTRQDHDHCLAFCLKRQHELTTEEYLLLNLIAGSWAISEPVTSAELRLARDVLGRFPAGDIS